jgi:hypothetical protein
MAEAKKLLLSLLVDTKQADKLTQVFKTWDTKMKGLAPAFGKLGLGDQTTKGGRDNLTKSLVDTTNQLAKFGLASQKTSKILQDGFGRAIEKDRLKLEAYKKSIVETEKQIEHFDKKLEQMKSSGRVGARAHVETARNEAFNKLVSTQQTASGLAEKIGIGGGDGGAGGGGGSGVMSSILGRLIAPTAIASMATLAIRTLLRTGEIVDTNRLRPSELGARVGSTWGQMAMGPGNRDYTDILAKSMANSDTLGTLANPDSAHRYMSQFARGLSALNPLSSTPILDAGLLGYDEEAGATFRKGEAGAVTQKYFENLKATSPELVAGVNRFAGGAGQTLGFQRQMGMGDESLKGFLGGTHAATGGNYNTSDIMAAASSIEAAGGGRARGGLTSAVLNAQTLGISDAASIAGPLAAGGSASSILSKVSGLTPSAGSAAGQFIAGNYLSGNGIVSGEGLADYMTGGVGGMDSSLQARQVAMRGAGLSAMGVGLGGAGSDPYTRALGMANAMNVNPKGSFFSQDTLSSLNPAEAMGILKGGDVSPALKAQGITKEMVSKQMSSTFGENLASRIGGLDNGGTDDVSKMARFVSTKGNDLFGAIKGGGLKDQLGLQGDDATSIGVLLHKAGFASSPEEGAALVAGIRGGSTESGKALGGTAAGEVEKTAKGQEFKQFMEGFDLVKNLPKNLMDFSESIKIAAENLDEFNQKMALGMAYGVGAGPL